MPQREQWKRILEIDRRVRAGLYPHPDALAHEWEVSRRVIFNDRQYLLDQLHAPLAFDRQRRGWHYTDKTFVLPAAVITQGELLAFFLSVEVAKRYMGTVLETPLLSAIDKIAQTLPDKVQVDLERLRSHYTFATPAMALANEETLMALEEAITQQQAVHIRYYTASRGEWNQRIVHPHHLHHLEGDWHLIAFDPQQGRLKTFNAGRINEPCVLPQRFTRQPDFDAQQWLRTMFQSEQAAEVVTVAIRFDEYQARWIRERRYHATQQIEELEDGGLILRFQASGLGDVQRWVSQYGSHAEVLSPPALRAALTREAQRMTELYGRHGD